MARIEEFDDIQLDVEFTQAGSRSNLTSNENIAISFGKIAKWYEALVPTGGSSGQFLGFNSSGTAKWVSNPNVDEKVKSTKISQSTAAASYYPTLMSGETTAGVGIIDSAKINHTPGTTSVVGNTRLVLGNATNEGTTNNEEGLLRIYSPGTKYHTIKGAKITTDNVEHILPTTGGTILNTGTTSFTQILSSGTKIGTIKINGTSSDIYAPTDTDTKVTQSSSTTSDFRPLLLGKNNQTNPENLETTVTDQTYVTKHVFVQPSTGNLTLYNASGDSPSLIFRRGTMIDNTLEWRIQNVGGKLNFDRDKNESTETWENIFQLDPSNNKLYFKNTEVSLSGHTHNYVPNTQTGMNTAINLLATGSSDPQLADYYISQYAGGGTTTTTYHRRPISALWNTFKSLITVGTTGTGNAVTSVSIGNDGNNRKITFTKGSTFLTSHQSVTDGNPTLSWGNQSTVATIGSTNIHVTMPANPNTDTKVTQSSSTTSNYRPVMLGYTNTTTVSDLAATVTNQVYATTNLFHKPSSGYLYSTAFSTAGYLTGAGAQLVQSGLYLKAYKEQADSSVLDYGRYVVRTYTGKVAVDPSGTAPNGAGMLVTIESGGMVIVGSGESAKNLADLISDDQSEANASRTRLNVGGTLNTAFSGDTETLILSSDNSIYFLTNCNTITDRTPVVLNTSSSFYPGTTGTGSIGTSSYRWNTAYINTIYENGTSLANKYAGISHTHATTIAADSGTSQLTLSANTKYKLTAGDTTFIFTTPTDNDTKVTSSANHYTPSTASGQDKSASASGATAAWSIDVVKGVTLNTDGKGHVTGMSVTSGKIPANPIPSYNVTGSAAWTTADRILVTNASSGNVIKQSSYTIATSVPANALFTDTWTAMVGATSSANGSVGYVNAVPPKDGYNTKFLRADGSWAVPANTTYSAGTGLSLSGTTFNHANSVTAKDDYNKKFFTHDAQGHITDVSWYIHKASGTNGSNSDSTWIKIATLVHTATYNNSPITITFTQRGNTTRNRLTIRFGSADSKDPPLTLFLLTCDALWALSNSRALIVKTATSTWDIYIKKLDTHEIIHVSDFDIGSTGSTKLTWTWQDEQVTTTPADATEATKKVYSTTDHTHSYAGSSSAGGAATSADKLNTNAGSATRPVYFSSGVPVVTTAPASGAWFSSFTGTINSDGVLEVGRYVDFHATNTSANNYDTRLENTGTSVLQLLSNTGYVRFKIKGTTPCLQFAQSTAGSEYDSEYVGIRAYPGDTSGLALVMQSGGMTMITSGEAGSNGYPRMISTSDAADDTSRNPYLASGFLTTPWTGATETLILSSDSAIYFQVTMPSSTTVPTDWSNLKTICIDTNGAFKPTITNKGSIGTSSLKWASMYATMFYGDMTFDSFANATADASRHVFFKHNTANKICTNDSFMYNPYTNILTVGSITGSAAKWTTARTITIGSSGKSVDGSGNVSWTLAEIGAAAKATTLSGYGITDAKISNGTITLGSNSLTPITSIPDIYVLTAGDTMSGNLSIQKSSESTYFITKRTDTDVQVGFGVGSGGTNHGIYSYTQEAWLIYGDAENNYIKSNIYNPSDYAELYALPLLGGTPGTGPKALYNTNGFRYSLQQGTASLVGTSRLILGNGTASGSAGNKKGSIRLYSENQSYIDLTPDSTASGRNLTLPAVTATLAVSRKAIATDSNSDFASYAWHKFAEVTITNTNYDYVATFIVSSGFIVSSTYAAKKLGILTMHVRTSNTRVFAAGELEWLVAGSQIDPNNFVMVYTDTANTSCKVELWYKQIHQYEGYTFNIIDEHTRTVKNIYTMTLSDTSGHGSSVHTTGTGSLISKLGKIKNAPGVYVVKGTQTASTSAWTGKIDVSELYDGLTILFYLPYAATSTSVTLNLTLSDGTQTGAVDCYYTGTSRITTHYGAGSTIILTYWSAGSISVAGTATTNNRWTHCDYNANSYTNQGFASASASRPLLMSYYKVGETSTSAQTTYRNDSIYANPNTGAIYATTFVGEITTLAFLNRIYGLYQTTSGSTWNGNETLITSIPNASGTSTPNYQRVKTIDFIKDCISGLKEPVLYDNTINPQTSTTINLPNGIPRYLKVFIGAEYSSDGSTYTDTNACINCIDVDMAHSRHGGFIGYDAPGPSGVGNYLAYCYVNVTQNTGSTTAYTVGISYANFLNLSTSTTIQNVIARIVKIIAVY